MSDVCYLPPRSAPSSAWSVRELLHAPVEREGRVPREPSSPASDVSPRSATRGKGALRDLLQACMGDAAHLWDHLGAVPRDGGRAGRLLRHLSPTSPTVYQSAAG